MTDTTETVARPKSEVLAEIREIVLAVFGALGYRNMAHYDLSKENYAATYLIVTIKSEVHNTRKATWDKMFSALEVKFGGHFDFKFIDSEYRQIRVLFTDECERRGKLPKEELSIEYPVRKVNKTVRKPVHVKKPINPPVEKTKKAKAEKPVVSTSPKNKIPRYWVASLPKNSDKILYNRKVIKELYRELYLSLQNETGLKIGSDFTIANADGSTLELRYIPSQGRGKVSFEQRLEVGRKHFVEKFGDNAQSPYFSVIVVDDDPAYEKIIILNVENEYNRRCLKV
ncbi:MAG: hypothetical protein WCG55_02005 [bacterium]